MGFVSDYNFLDPRFAFDEDGQTLAQWRTITGDDAHSTPLTLAQMQALFADYAARNFTLAPGSAAIDAGFYVGAYEAPVPEPGAAALAAVALLLTTRRRRACKHLA